MMKGSLVMVTPETHRFNDNNISSNSNSYLLLYIVNV